MNTVQKIKMTVDDKASDITEEYGITPWKVTKTVAGMVGAAMSSFVVGTILRNQMPAQPKTFDMVKAAVGIYLMEGVVSNAVSNYVGETLSTLDPVFDPETEGM